MMRDKMRGEPTIESDWEEVQIADICLRICSGGTPKSTNLEYYTNGTIPWLNTKEINFNRIYETDKMITERGLFSSSAKWIDANAVIVALYGETAGKVAVSKIPLTTNQACCNLIIDANKADYNFVYYSLRHHYSQLLLLKNGGAQQNLNVQIIKNYKLPLPPLPVQKKIAAILSSLDDKIEINTRMNKVLEETARALFHRWFVEFEFPNDEGKPYKSSGGRMIASEMGEIPEGWTIKRAQEICNISIGKTPPRKETQWFTSNSSDVKWISISDMGSSGMFVLDSSEYLTVDAIEKFNIVTVPKDTVILSFKLTIGRVSITSEDLVTNEAIAHFKTNIQELREYLYFTLKCYDYVSLGSTSSIATAINSKIIKNMNILLPHINLIKDYHALVLPIFEIIRTNQTEINQLKKIRETVLPKLMGGGIIS